MNAQRYITSFERVYGKLSDAEASFLKFSLENFVMSRNDRARDILSDEISESIRIEQRLLACGLPRTMLCVDGRVLAKLVASLHGGAIRTPAADNAEFLPFAEGEGLFLSEGELARILRRAFFDREMVTWVLDSHLHCAARKTLSTEVRGSVPADDGLFDDIVRKRKIAEALRRFVRRDFNSQKQLILIHVSFDPHSGYLFMGLEKEDVVNDARVVRNGFTGEILSCLVDEGRILSTERWSREGGMLFEVFSKHVFNFDYESAYRESTILFWQNLEKISKEVSPLVEREIVRVFPELDGNKKVLRERSILLLANAFTAFLLNRRSEGYPYSEHDESVIVVTSGDRGPYDRMRSFSVDPYNPNLSFVVKFVEGLIRNNRSAGHSSAIESKTVADLFGVASKEYVMSAVPVFFFQKLEQEHPSEVIRTLGDTDWSDIAVLPWMDMPSEEFKTFLKGKIPTLPDDISEKIEQLREGARAIFQPGLSATDDLLSGRLLPVFALRSLDHEIVALFPFLAKGYREKVK